MRSELRAAKRAAEAAAAELLREQAARPVLVDEAVARALQACEVRAARVDASAAAAAAGAAADARAQLQRLQASKASARAAGSAKDLAEEDARCSKIRARNAEGHVRSLEHASAERQQQQQWQEPFAGEREAAAKSGRYLRSCRWDA